MTGKSEPELTEAELLACARELGFDIPAEQRQSVLSGANRLRQAARLLHEFLPPAIAAGE